MTITMIDCHFLLPVLSHLAHCFQTYSFYVIFRFLGYFSFDLQSLFGHRFLTLFLLSWLIAYHLDAIYLNFND
jgi:hypothetical protein